MNTFRAMMSEHVMNPQQFLYLKSTVYMLFYHEVYGVVYYCVMAAPRVRSVGCAFCTHLH